MLRPGGQSPCEKNYQDYMWMQVKAEKPPPPGGRWDIFWLCVGDKGGWLDFNDNKKGRRGNPAAGGERDGLLPALFALFGHGGLAGEADLAVVLDGQHLDPDFLAHLDDGFRAVFAAVGELADVDEAFLAG